TGVCQGPVPLGPAACLRRNEGGDAAGDDRRGGGRDLQPELRAGRGGGQFTATAEHPARVRRDRIAGGDERLAVLPGRRRRAAAAAVGAGDLRIAGSSPEVLERRRAQGAGLV